MTPAERGAKFATDVQWLLLKLARTDGLGAVDHLGQSPVGAAQLLHQMARGECSDSCLICGTSVARRG